MRPADKGYMLKGANKKFWRFFTQMAKPYRWWFVAMLFVGVYSAVHSVVQPYVLKILLDGIASHKATDFLTVSLKPAIVLIVLGFIITFIWRLYNYIVLKALPKIKADIISVTTDHLRAQSYVFFQDKMTGEISTKISDLTANLQSTINSWFNIVRQGLTVILAIVAVGSVSLYFSLVFFIMTLVFIYLAYHCANSIRPYASAYAEARSKASGGIVDCFSNVLSMLLFSREGYEAQYLNKSTEISVSEEIKMQFKNMKNASILGLFAWLLQGSSTLLLLYLGSKGLITAGDFAFVFMLAITVIDQVWFLTESLLVVGEQVGICECALETIFTEHMQPFNPLESVLSVDNGGITLSNVSFEYNKDVPVIKDFSLDIPGGSKLGLVGYSGAGKSTIAYLLTRLFDASVGEVCIDGQCIAKVTRQSLREAIAFIPQQPNLFHRSIYDNILYGNIKADKTSVIDAAKKAEAHEFIVNLPNGYDTVVGERGLKLSGGQRQRISIARAILKDAPILILDEATSSLDSMTEQLIQKSLHVAMRNRTAIVIAHRLSTLLTMDKIVVMDQGKIIESGSHTELVEKGGFYNNLWDAQSGHSLI